MSLADRLKHARKLGPTAPRGVSVYLTPPEYEALAVFAKLHSLSLAEAMRVALHEMLDQARAEGVAGSRQGELFPSKR